MISKHYMCLSSRFGYHACTNEALVDHYRQRFDTGIGGILPESGEKHMAQVMREMA